MKKWMILWGVCLSFFAFCDDGDVVNVTAKNFQEEVIRSKLPVVLDAYADWCPPCQDFAPTFSKLGHEMAGSVKFVKVNVDKEMSLTKKLKVKAMPTLLFYEKGEMVDRHVGLLSKDALVSKINQVFKKIGENVEK